MVLQVVASFAFIVYVLGFVIVNSHYYLKYGITSYEVPQAKVIAAGLLFIIPHAIFVYFMTFNGVIYRAGKSVFVIFVLLFVAFSVTVSWLLSGEISVASSAVIAIATLLAVLPVSILLSIAVLSPSSSRYTLSRFSTAVHFFFVPASFLCFFLLLISAVLWANTFWPGLPAVLGGGQTISGAFVIKDGGLDLKSIPIIRTQSPNVTIQYPILFESSTDYFVIIASPADELRIVRISRSIVQVVFYSSRPSQNGFPSLLSNTPTPTAQILPVITTTITQQKTPINPSPSLSPSTVIVQTTTSSTVPPP